MKLSYIINTAAGDRLASSPMRGNRYRRTSYSERGRLLSEHVIPAALDQGFHYASNGEIIVAGVWKDGANYRYVNVDPVHRDRRDALWQRELGARHATGDIFIFGHDDHKVGPGFQETLRTKWLLRDDWDILVPRRLHGITGADMPNGREGDFMGGHVFVMRRWLWARIPMTAVDTEWWDVSLTRIWREEGGRIVFADDLTHVDVEALEDEG